MAAIAVDREPDDRRRPPPGGGVGNHDALNQRVISQKVVITNGDVRLYPVQIRYVWPSELDLMAQLAGLKLRERWSNWHRAPFDSDSGSHISIYERD